MTRNQQQTAHYYRSGFVSRTTVRFTALVFLLAVMLIAYQSNREPGYALNGVPSKTVVINEIYGGGGNAGATYTNDFVELLNISTTAIDVSAWSVQYQSTGGTTWNVVNICSSTTAGTCVIPPGSYYLVVLGSQAAVGIAPPASDAPSSTLNISGAQGKVALVNSRTALPTNSGSNCTGLPVLGAPAVIDEVGYGTSSNACFEGSGPALTNPNSQGSTTRNSTTDTDQNSTDFTTISPPTPQNSASAPISPTASDAVVSGNLSDSNGAAIAGAVVRLSGTQNRKTSTDANGNYRFENVETGGFYTATPSATNFVFSPSEKSFSQIGNTTSATFVGSVVASVNPLDTPEYFVRQHYLDFLGREPDEAGFNFWSDQILACGFDAACIERRTINVSAAYFHSIEFQHTGGLVDRLYRASYGRNPLYAEFMPDTATIARNVQVGRNGWDATLAANREAFIASWVERAAFRAAFDSLTDDAYVGALIANTNASFTQAERDSLVSGLGAGTLSRAAVLQQIVNNENFARARFNEAFVMMEYFGYLRRDPDAAGLHFWLNKLNEFEGNFERAEMVKAFINSGEYRSRFVQ